ncbi:MAG: sugar phosphate nucleotidyltransferase [Gemmatimonadaceae bacterium]
MSAAFDSSKANTFTPSQGAGVGTLAAEQRAPVDEKRADAALWGIVLAGGIGSRFWPLSSPQRPKQLLSLISDRPLIAETVDRLHPLIPSERVLVVTSRDIAPAIAAAIPNVPSTNILIEPAPLGTAAAVAWATSEIARRAGPESVCCCMHADLAVGFVPLFHDSLKEATRVASLDDVLVAIGIRATRPDVGFGYVMAGTPIESGRALDDMVPCEVASFVEKPDAATAERLVNAGALWNAGVFAWRARVLWDALEAHCPEVAPGLPMVREGDHDGFVQAISSISIERGLLERTKDLVVVPGDFGWDDVGTWASLRRARDLDDDGNGISGTVYTRDATGNVVHAEASRVVLYGVSGLLVVSLNGMTFVTTLERAADLRPLLDGLPDGLRYPGTPPSTATS